MVELLGVQRFDDAYVVGHARQVRQQLGDFHAAAAMALEAKPRAQQIRMPAQKGESLSFDEMRRHRLSVVPLHYRFVVEQLQVGRGADHVQVDDVLGARREVRTAYRFASDQILL